MCTRNSLTFHSDVIDVAPTAGSMGNIYTTTSTSSADQGADETSSIFSSNPEVLSDSTVLDYRPHPAFCPSFMFWCLLLYIFR